MTLQRKGHSKVITDSGNPTTVFDFLSVCHCKCSSILYRFWVE